MAAALIGEMEWESIRISVFEGFNPSIWTHLGTYSNPTTRACAMSIGEFIMLSYTSCTLLDKLIVKIPSFFDHMLFMYLELKATTYELVSASWRMPKEVLGNLVLHSIQTGLNDSNCQPLTKLVTPCASRIREVAQGLSQMYRIWIAILNAKHLPNPVLRCCTDAVVADSRPALLDKLTSVKLKAYYKNIEFVRVAQARIKNIQDRQANAPSSIISFKIEGANLGNAAVTAFLRSDEGRYEMYVPSPLL